jgi:hypothetical protein
VEDSSSRGAAEPHRKRDRRAGSIQMVVIFIVGLGAIASIIAFFWLAQG